MKWALIVPMLSSSIFCDSVIAKNEPTTAPTEKIYYSMEIFYPHLGNSMCRKKAFDIVFDTSIHQKKKFESWENYKTVCSKDGSYQLILAAMYLSYGYFDQSREVLENIIKNYKNYDTRYHELQLHTTYRCLGEIRKAFNLAKKMIVDYTNWYGGHQALGADCLSRGDHYGAKKSLETAIKLYDKDPVTYLLLTSVSYELKEDDKVIYYYKKSLALDPLQSYFDWRSSAAAVSVYVLKKEFTEAKKILDHQQEFFPEIKKDQRFNTVKEYYEHALNKAAQIE